MIHSNYQAFAFINITFHTSSNSSHNRRAITLQFHSGKAITVLHKSNHFHTPKTNSETVPTYFRFNPIQIKLCINLSHKTKSQQFLINRKHYTFRGKTLYLLTTIPTPRLISILTELAYNRRFRIY